MVATQGPAYLIEKAIPRNRVHLLAGISSAGKTRWAYPTFWSWNACLPVMGLKSYPVPWCIVSGDRPLIDVEESISTMDLPLEEFKIIPAFGKHHKNRVQIMEAIEEGGYRFVLWEGFDFLVRNPNNPNEVAELLSNMAAYCEEGLTILGIVGVPKLKPGEGYENPRQLIGGSTIWERCTSTNIIIAPVNPKDVADPSRMLYACLKNSDSFRCPGAFDEHGRLTFSNWNCYELEAKESVKKRSRFDIQ